MGDSKLISTKKGKILLCIVILFFAAFEVFLWTRRIGRHGVFIKRTVITCLIAIFAGLHFFVNIRKLYDWMYRYRWWIALGVFVFMVLNKYHTSSLSMWNAYIQPQMGSEYVDPILGVPRPIRSDEWVMVPETLSGVLTHFAEYNNLVTGSSIPNMTASGLYLDYVELAHPNTWGYFLFGMEYGMSFSWIYRWVFGFMFNFELFLILTKEKRILSLLGASMLFFSMFNMWWSLPYQTMNFAGILVLFYYFMNTKNALHRFGYGTALAVIGADFCTRLYPAWQVPIGWVIVGGMLLILYNAKDTVHFKSIDRLIFVIDVLFMVSLIARYVYVTRVYSEAIMNTVYPGKRVSYGGFGLDKLLGYITTLTTPMNSHDNPCEMSCLFGVFPLSYILVLIVQIKQKFKNKTLWFYSVPAILLTIYCTIELPPLIAKLFLMTYSLPMRAVDMLAINLLILMIVSISELQDDGGMPIWLAVIICTVCLIPAVNKTLTENPQYMLIYIILSCFTALLEPMIVYGGKYSKAFQAAGAAMFTVLGLSVHPLVYGLDALYSKPAADEIKGIVAEDPDALWCGLDNFVIPNYIVACGGRTLNCVNQIPNMKFWKIMDPKGEYEEVYNRYAHFQMVISDETEIILNQADLLTLKITEEDFAKTGVKYLLSIAPLDKKYSSFDEIYHEGNTYIYQYNPS